MLKYKWLFDIGLDRRFMNKYKNLNLFLSLVLGFLLLLIGTAYANEKRSSYVNEILDDYEKGIRSKEEVESEILSLGIYNCPYFDNSMEEDLDDSECEDPLFKWIFDEHGGRFENCIYSFISESDSIATSSETNRVSNLEWQEEISSKSEPNRVIDNDNLEELDSKMISTSSQCDRISTCNLKKHILKSYFYKMDQEGKLELSNGGPFIDSEDILINLYFKIPKYNNENKIEYLLPKEFHIEGESSALIYGEDDSNIGEFQIDANGKIHILYEASFLEQARDKAISGMISLKGKLMLPKNLDKSQIFFGGKDGFIVVLSELDNIIKMSYENEYIPPTGVSLPYMAYISMIMISLIATTIYIIYRRAR